MREQEYYYLKAIKEAELRGQREMAATIVNAILTNTEYSTETRRRYIELIEAEAKKVGG